MNITLIGPQGSGKGTQARLISAHSKIPYISTGDIFRDCARANTELGRKVKKLIDNGFLVPDDVVNDIVKERLGKQDVKGGFVLDGYPRNISQAKVLDKLVKIDYVFEIRVSDKESIKRLSSRRQCKLCNAIYGLNSVKKCNECDKCGGELYQRNDDKEDAIKKRLETYHRETEPLTHFYKKKGLLISVNGEQSIEKIFDDIRRSFGG